MSIDASQVEHIARLSRLAITPEETALYSRQLGNILGHIEKLGEMDTKGVEPTSHSLGLKNVTREDTPRPCLTPDEALSNAPDRNDDFYRVPRIIEE